VPRISLYIPCYNAAGYLDRVLAAVMAQTHPIGEVLVIDDGSTDETVAVAGRWLESSRYPLRIIRHPENLGLASARNTGVREARSELVASVDSDVAPEPDWLARLAQEMTPDVSGVGGELREAYQTELPDRWRAKHMLQRRGPERIYRPPFIWGSNSLFRREVLFEAGLYNVVCRTNAEDVKLCEIIRDRHVLIYTPFAKCNHLRRDTVRSVMRNFWKWYYYGCFQKPSPGCAVASNGRHFRRLWGILKKDVAERDPARIALTLTLFPYTFARDWIDWWRRRNEA
jgi:glycosyltransferase involved in cell wall biosynthesis